MRDIRQWIPYLDEMLGKDEHGRRHVSEVHTLAKCMISRDLFDSDRMELTDQLERLDIVRQVFLFPWVMEQFGNASPVMRRRLIAYFKKILQGRCAELVEKAEAFFSKKQGDDCSEHLGNMLKSLASCLTEQKKAGVGEEHDLAELSSQRTAVFALALLTAITQWIDLRTDDSERLTMRQNAFFDDLEQEELDNLLKRWRSFGPLFFRFLLLDWSAARCVSKQPDAAVVRDAAQALLKSYQEDKDPLIASLAIQGLCLRCRACRRCAGENQGGAVKFCQPEGSCVEDTDSCQRCNADGQRRTAARSLHFGLAALSKCERTCQRACQDAGYPSISAS